jgi:hypothetical protein
MSEKDFIKNKLSLMQKDKQPVFDKLAEPLQKMAQEAETGKKIKIPVDGNWFTVSFDAVEVKQNRLVISARRMVDGLTPSNHNPAEKEYVVIFEGTRAAYLKGYYKNHVVHGWPYIGWDIRSYADHPSIPKTRVYVNGFIAHDEIRKMVVAMERVYGVSNIYNNYINDNLNRVQNGIRAGRSIQEIEKIWSKGLMESLGYHFVEAFDTGHPKGNWKEIHVHWCKFEKDLRG